MSTANSGKNPVDLVQIQTKSKNGESQRFWRSMDELAGSERYQDFTNHEFTAKASVEPTGLTRRDAMKWMAASAAFAGLAACTKLPTQKIVPYVRAPEQLIPGKNLYYATAYPQGGVGAGILAASYMGRPIKIEGNPEHPASLGATDVFAQASILTMYDPDRSPSVMHDGRINTWEKFLDVIRQVRGDLHPSGGEGLHILTENVTSPTLGAQLQAVMAAFPSAKWHQFDASSSDAVREGARLAFGQYVNVYYRLDQADVILSLDNDFFSGGPGNVRYAHDFMARRVIQGESAQVNRLYVAESMTSNTGATADHRLPVNCHAIEALARAVAKELGVAGGESAGAGLNASWIAAVARDLKAHSGKSLVIAGEHQPPVVHALAHAMNEALGNIGTTVICTDPIEVNPKSHIASISELVADMKADKVKALLILGGNPVYTAPADLEFAKNLLRVPLRMNLSLYRDETAELCNWHVPQAHYLEAWGDIRSFDGTATIQQPLIAPLYDGKAPQEIIATLLGKDSTAHDAVKAYWQNHHGAEAGFQAFWDTSLHDGVVKGTAFTPKSVSAKASAAAIAAMPMSSPAGLQISFRPDPTIGDGSHSNNGWLQELPKPLIQLTWDNAAMLSAGTAQKLSLQNDDVITLNYEGRKVDFPVFIVPGHADDCVTVNYGYGRTRAGRVGNGIGSNAYALRTSRAPWHGSGLKVEKTGKTYALISTQFHHAMDQGPTKVDEPSVEAFNRNLIRVGTVEEYRKNPEFAKDPEEFTDKNFTLYPNFEYKGYAWGMSIDLNKCTGCNACVVACQSENNIAVVGKEQVGNGREMQWIRIDTYFRGGLDNPEIHHEPIVCMQCEDAPCEVVCPAGATMHSPEGLNEMVYNRCIGTRYCSNNCPYKVRHFNFKLWSDWETPSLKLMRNPNVTVRSRGIMEKCTYCVQRINAAKIEAEKEDRQVRDGEIATACESVCPAGAIVFGNVNDPKSRVTKLKAEPRNFALLADLNTRPRTTYLAKLRNPNPEIKG